MAPLIPEIASTLPSQFVAGFWTLQAILNGYGLLVFAGWYRNRR